MENVTVSGATAQGVETPAVGQVANPEAIQALGINVKDDQLKSLNILQDRVAVLIGKGEPFVAKDGEVRQMLLLAAYATVESQSTSEADRLFNGWSGNSQVILRKPQIASKALADTLQLGKPVILDGRTAQLYIVDSLTPHFTKRDGTPQEPRRRSAANGGKLLVNSDNKKVYRDYKIELLEGGVIMPELDKIISTHEQTKDEELQMLVGSTTTQQAINTVNMQATQTIQ